METKRRPPDVTSAGDGKPAGTTPGRPDRPPQTGSHRPIPVRPVTGPIAGPRDQGGRRTEPDAAVNRVSLYAPAGGYGEPAWRSPGCAW